MKKIVLPLDKEEKECYFILLKLFGLSVLLVTILFAIFEWIHW